VVPYPAMLDVPRELVLYVSGLLDAHRRLLGTRSGARALGCYRQALLGLVWFREKRPIPLIGRGFGVSQATSYRYVNEVIEVLADQAPDLRNALESAAADGWSHVIVDGAVIETDRLGEKRLSVKGYQVDAWYSGKAKGFGGNVQAVMRPDGFPVWTSDVEPGSTHDITAAREHVLGACYWAASQLDLPTLADLGYEGAGIGVHTPIKVPVKKAIDGNQLDRLDPDNRTYNTLLRALRALGERGFALLTQRWRTLQHITTSPTRIGDITRAALVLTHYEHNYQPC
jgi:hypothetical protein